MILEIIIAGGVIMLASLSGILFTWKGVGVFIQNNLRFLTSFALGVFLTTLFLMLRETIELEANMILVALSAGLGALFLEVVGRIIPEAHHHHGNKKEECCEHTTIHTINPLRVLAGDAIHNIGDGILLVPAFLIDLQVGIAAFVGILLHEFIQEISEFFILKETGYTTKQALVSNFAVSSTIFIGIGASLFFAQVAKETLPLLIAFAAGSFLFLIVRDLLPHTIHTIRHSGKLPVHIFVILTGIIVLMSAVHIIPHSHNLEIEHKELDAYREGLMKS